jgi:hypothetical protein
MIGSLFMENDLERRFQDIYLGAATHWRFVQDLQECFEVSSPSMADALSPYLDRSIREAMGEDFPQHFNHAAHPAILRRVAENKIASARSAIDSASVVIIHAALDEAVNHYLLLIAMVKPALWETYVCKEDVPMKAIKHIPYADLLLQKALAVAKGYRGKSLPNKVQWIIRTCHRNDCTLSPPEFRFDVDRLKNFDLLRHKVAHGPTCYTVTNMDEVLLFLWQTLLSLQDVIGNRLGFNQDPTRELERQAEVRSLQL